MSNRSIQCCLFCRKETNTSKIQKRHYSPSEKATGLKSAYVYCTRCKARGPLKKTVDEAINAWNELHRLLSLRAINLILKERTEKKK